MSEHKGPRPVAWEGWHAAIGGDYGGFVSVQEFEDRADGGEVPGRGYSMRPREAEKHGCALIMAAAVARGEHGHTAALNRVAVALGYAPAGDDSDLLDAVAALADAGVSTVHRSAGDAVRAVVAERDRLRAEVAELREGLDAAEAARAEAVQEAARLRVELGEAREALAGKTQHDAAAEVVAPLRERLGVGGEVSPGFVVQQAVRLIPSVVQMGGSPTWCKCGGERSGAWCTNCANPTREPMTHTSLASIEQHGVVVGDRLEWVSWPAAISLCEAVLRRGGLTVETQGGHRWPDVAVMMHNSDESWPLTVVEAPDAD